MGRNSKTKRDLKKRKKIKNQNKQENFQFNQKAVQTKKKFYAMDNPLGDISINERKEIIDSLGKQAAEDFSSSLTEIENILSNQDPLQLLSMLSFYGLTTGISKSGIVKTDSGVGEINQFHPEFCQAFILRDEKYNHCKIVKPNTYPQFREHLLKFSNAMFYQDYSSDKLDMTEEDFAIETIRKQVLSHTRVVRNWGFISQVKEVSTSLFKDLDPIYESSLGFTATDAIKFFESLLSIIESKFTEKLETTKLILSQKSKKSLINIYHKTILNDESEEKANDFLKSEVFKESSLKTLQSMLLTHQDLFIKDIFTFDSNSFADFLGWKEERVKNLLKCFSLDFGDLSDSKVEYVINDNPIWARPIINTSSNIFYCFTPQVFFSFVIKTLTNLGNSFAKIQIEKRKAQFLEQRIENIVRSKFSDNQTFSAVKWKHNGQEFETDIITIIDTCLLIIEAKSGQITSPALRGAPGRLKTHLKEIIISPNQQSKRLKEKIISIQEGKDHSPELQSSLKIDIKEISKIIRLSVSLEDFAMIQSNIKRHERTGWLPNDFSPCPTMNIGDFETLFDLLDHPLNIVHYLSRREEIEENINFFGDELDLLGFYVKTLFDASCLPDEGNILLNLDGEDKIVTQYYDSKSHDINLPKPTPDMTPFWQNLITMLEERNFKNWTQIGLVLLQVSPEDQKKVVKQINKIKKNVKNNWNVEGHVNTLLWSPPNSQNTSMAFVFFCRENWSERDKLINSAADQGFSKSHIKRCIVFAINIDAKERSYDLVGMFLRGED